MSISVVLRVVALGFSMSVASSYAAINIVSDHCPLGCPTLTEHNLLTIHHTHTLSLNTESKFADWIAYSVNPDNFAPGDSPGRQWRSDPLVPDDWELEPADYKGIGKAKYDRGHGAPLAAFAGSPYYYEVNYLTNITPQAAALNQGAWMRLESAVRNGARSDNPLYVITGSLYGDTYQAVLPAADEKYVTPVGYFKIVYDTDGHSAAFYMAQSTERKSQYCEKLVNVSELTPYFRFEIPAKLVSSALMASRLGCR